MKLAWGNKVSPQFRSKVISIAKGFGWPDEAASWLMACIAFETGRTFSPSIRNAAGSGATGLIQFMPTTAKGLGTTTDELAAMDAVAQLDYVAKYFKPYAGRIKSLSDLYMAILLPKAVGMPDDYKLFAGGTAYRQNAGLDANSDGVITKAEASGRVQATLWQGMQEPNVYQPKENDMSLAGTVLVNALPMLVNKLPEIAKVFKNPDVAERNVEAVSKVGQILVEATGATNVQEAVEKVDADPATARQVNEALRVNRAELMDAVERLAKIEDARVESAREYNRGEPLMINTRRFKAKFVHLVSLLLILFGGVAAGYILATSTDQTERAMALQTLLVVGFAGVATFWLGSSRSSQVKDEVRGAQ